MMNKVYVTGDCHRSELAKIRSYTYHHQDSSANKSNIMVVLGDWGAIWYGNFADELYLDFWEQQPFSTFVVLGNHENYEAIEKYPILQEYGGLVRKPRPSISIVVDSGIYNLNGKICACINGANSIDTEKRIKGKTWWPQEVISSSSTNSLLKQLEQIDYKIDFLFSHTGGSEVAKALNFSPSQSDLELDKIINKLNEKEIEYEHYLAHYHLDMDIDNITSIMYKDILRI